MEAFAAPPTDADPRPAGGHRNVLACEAVRRVALGPELESLAARFGEAAPRLARGVLFDKTPDANWRVGWHQDLVTAFAERVDAPGYTAWSDKEGVPHAKPPIGLLERMVTVRVHLDDCGPNDGPLQVLPGTHRGGELSTAAIREAVATNAEEVCMAQAGDALVMRPLLLHASAKAAAPSRRRVLHLEYAYEEPPGGPGWRDWSAPAAGR